MESPAPDQIKAARIGAGHTQAQAMAVLLPGGSYRTWADWERGVTPMPPDRWQYYLLMTDQHPDLKVVKRLRKP
jgi:hypothetical protein